MDSRPQITHGSEAYTGASSGPVVTIGNFDGVHRGHRTLLGATCDRARQLGVPAVVYTFDPAPRDVLRPDNGIPRIQTLADKAARLGEVGIDHMVVEPFSREFGAHSAQWFAEEVLGRRLGASALVLGWDFRFGRGREGTVDKLRQWLNVDVVQVPPFAEDGLIVSSSRIREAVRAGAIELAAQLLGRPHELVGEVIHGDARGRGLGFPTANLVPETALLPPNGVYAVYARWGANRLAGVANLGLRPTFGGGHRRLEVHLFDFEGDLYGTRLHVELCRFVRPERAFSGVEDLRAQIREDAEAARSWLG